MAHEQDIATILVQLDALLDTRLGTLALMNPDAVETILKAGYRTRLVDSFKDVDMVLFQDMYANRDELTLFNAMPTEMIYFLNEMVQKLVEQLAVRPYHKGVKVVVNVHPYTLSAENKVTIAETITQWIQNLAPVEIVSLSDEDLTPAHINATYSAMILYNWHNWLKIHAPAFGQTPCVGVVLYVPEIHFFANSETFAQDVENMTKQIANPIEALKWITAPMFTLETVGANLFSILQNRHTPTV